MLSRQNMIHIATDVVLITMLFVYINNKSKAANDAIEELRDYTEEQIDNINTKLDNLIKYVMKQKSQQQSQHVSNQTRQQYQIPKQTTQQFPHQHVHYSQPMQQQPIRKSSNKNSEKTQQSQPAQSSQKNVRFLDQQQPEKMPSVQQNFNSKESHNSQLTQIDDFINSIPQSIAFISTTQYPSPQFVNKSQRQNTKIEVINETDEHNEEDSIEHNEEDKIEDNIEELDQDELDDMDMQEIENALSGDIKVSDDNKNEE